MCSNDAAAVPTMLIFTCVAGAKRGGKRGIVFRVHVSLFLLSLPFSACHAGYANAPVI